MLYESLPREILDKRMAAADKPGQHLWCMVVAWHVPDPRKVVESDDPQLMDQENLLSFSGPGCLKCEQPFSNRMAKRPCRGSVSDVQ